MPVTMILLEEITIHPKLQSRADPIEDEITEEVVQELIEHPDLELPPVGLVNEEKKWMWDGHGRFKWYTMAKRIKIPAEVKTGEFGDALELSWGANAEHGVRRTNRDKQKAVRSALMSKRARSWSDNKIAKHCKVSQFMVSQMRKKLQQEQGIEKGEVTYIRNGKEIKASPGRPPKQKETPIEEPSVEATIEESLTEAFALIDRTIKGLKEKHGGWIRALLKIKQPEMFHAKVVQPVARAVAEANRVLGQLEED